MGAQAARLALCSNQTAYELVHGAANYSGAATCKAVERERYADLDHGTSWLTRVPGNPLTEESPIMHQYMSSMYWSLTTLMKTPWVGPDTELEKLFASFAVVMGAILFAALLGNVTALVQTFDKGNAQKRDRITTLHQFTQSRKVPAALSRKLLAYVDAEWNVTAGLDDSSVLKQLPGQLRGTIVASIYRDSLLKAPLFASCSLECAKALLLRLQPEICLQKEVLIARDQLCQELYFLMRGAMQARPRPFRPLPLPLSGPRPAPALPPAPALSLPRPASSASQAVSRTACATGRMRCARHGRPRRRLQQPLREQSDALPPGRAPWLRTRPH